MRHLEGNGFGVDVEETEHLAPVRRELGVPVELAACHTAEVGGYVVEGHVPAAAIRQLLQKRPEALVSPCQACPSDRRAWKGHPLRNSPSSCSERTVGGLTCNSGVPARSVTIRVDRCAHDLPLSQM